MSWENSLFKINLLAFWTTYRTELIILTKCAKIHLTTLSQLKVVGFVGGGGVSYGTPYKFVYKFFNCLDSFFVQKFGSHLIERNRRNSSLRVDCF